MNAVKIYRLAHWLYRKRVPLLPDFLRMLMFFLYNSTIEPASRIGAGSYFAHGGIGVVIHPDCSVGERVAIGQGVTLGGSFGEGPPRVGDDVWIGPGARILGSIVVGSNVVVAANAVVLKDVPSNSIVGGVPAKLLKTIPSGALDTSTGTMRDSGR